MRHEFKTEQAFKLFNVIHKDIEEGDIAVVNDINKIFIYKDGDWCVPKLKSSSNVELTLYELNQQLMAQVPSLSQKDIDEAHKIINNFAIAFHQKHLMLLCHNKRYYTIFEQTKTYYEFGSLAAAVFACCEHIGEIKSVSLNEQNAIEIWIQDSYDNSVDCYYLFGYDEGMVYFA